ncbi:MAG: TIGR04211 family SH3 domain-containing protein [Gammaproteobacteria bacterium]|nr:MAG: TIGR04211 family SH3 domain-containing protein [Gammaproteobacteria bacterium]
MRILISALFALMAFNVQAATVYVSDEYRVPLRSSPCPRCSILHKGIKSGTALTLVETNAEGWSHVTTRSGLDGWMPSHYLQKEPTAREQLETMQARMASAEGKASELKEQLAALQEENNQLSSQLESLQDNNQGISSELQSIKKISSNAIAINQQNKELLERNGILQSEIDVLKASNERLSNSERNTWFLYGALAVVMGSLLTLLVPRLKKRKRYSEWA